MLATFKFFDPEIQSAKNFVRSHTTLVACVATAAVTYKLTRNRDYTRLGMVILTQQRELEVVQLRDAVLRDFVAQKGLKDEFLLTFIPSLSK